MYRVIDIEEDLDFGCEERPEGEKKKAIAVLQDEEGKVTRFRMEDELFTLRGILPGDEVWMDEEGKLTKK